LTGRVGCPGRFVRPISADDVLFGNTFDCPLKLPWGSGAALKFMQYVPSPFIIPFPRIMMTLMPLYLSFVDPALEHDLASSTKLWALSPLISMMPHLAHSRLSPASRSPLPANLHPGPHELRSSSRRAILHGAWPPFPPSQSLSDDTAQLHLTLRSSHSPSPLLTPDLSRQPSGRASSDSPV
jgi:hypothetical protein